MERYVGKVAIVTGASSGIGAAIAETLTKAGMKVVGLARRVNRIQTLSESLEKSGTKGKLYPVKCDVQVEEDILNAFDWTAKNVGNVQVLVNNAGVAPQSRLSDGLSEVWKKVFDTNVLALCIATREAVKVMKVNNIEGHIININSIVGHQHMYYQSVGAYGASKHAVTNLTEILRKEMVDQKTNIKVTSISPGFVRTEIVDVSAIPEELKEIFENIPALESKDIAEGVLYVLGVPERVQINELTLRPLNSEL